LQLRTHGSDDIRTFATSTSETITVTSNVIDLSDDEEIHETQVRREQASSLKSDLSSDADIASVLQEMFLPKVLEEILSGEDPIFLNRVLKNMQSNGLGSYSDIDQARYESLKSWCKEACPCLILSNPTNSHGEILGAYRSITDLLKRVGGRYEDIPKVAELRRAGLDGIPIRHNHLVVRMFLPSDVMSPDLKVGLANSGKGANNLELRHEVHGHVKIICKTMYPDLPSYSRIFALGTSAFAREYLMGKNHIFHVGQATEFGSNVAKGGAKGATFPGKVVRQGECKGKYFHGFTAIMVNKTTGEILTEEEWSRVSMMRNQNGNQNGNKKTKTK